MQNAASAEQFRRRFSCSIERTPRPLQGNQCSGFAGSGRKIVYARRTLPAAADRKGIHPQLQGGTNLLGKRSERSMSVPVSYASFLCGSIHADAAPVLDGSPVGASVFAFESRSQSD